MTTQTATVCPLCQVRGKRWEGGDPQCAFPRGVFRSENWNCATMNVLRVLARVYGLHYRDDLGPASIGAVPFESEEYQGYVVMTWYKNRGRTGMAVLMCDDREPEMLTLDIAMDAIRAALTNAPVAHVDKWDREALDEIRRWLEKAAAPNTR